jgi:transposase-like protein
MADEALNDESFDVECPHCHRHFRSRLLTGSSARHAGFKCPHCKLFVAYERTAGPPENAS